MTNRLNARLDRALAQKLEFLKRRTKKTVTEIVRDSIELYYAHARGEQGQAGQILDGAGFIGCGEADSDLSSTYKHDLANLVATKTGR